MKAILLRFVVAVLTFIIGLVLAKLAALFGLDDGNAKKVWASPNAAFEVRLTANLETGEYRFQSTTRDSNSRQDFLIFQLDDYAFISQEQAGFANDSIGYVAIAGRLAVTTDGGSTWTLWDADKQMPKSDLYTYNIIEWVDIKSDRTGQIVFKGERPFILKLYTEDYGRHWFTKPEQAACFLTVSE